MLDDHLGRQLDPNVIELSSARTALVVGDVPGRSIDAAARAGRLRTEVRTLAGMGLPLD
ncbi:SpoIIE family protein phosphatase [Kitasatospora acidiphila]|uniref:SpoIIE family protein phosphatase n=1 Tax=Kitasatospora acidiphila TaxID=2567942 RepID=UPI002B400125|nr:SpoIIE family protein phosphatase [Kitasatospora acidiphila]